MPQDNKIKIRRGLNSSLPAANTEVGELRYSTDTKELYIDDGTNNVKIGGNPLGFPVSTATQTALNLKANLDSPALTGTPTAPTASAGTNTTQLATTAFTLANRGDRYLTTSTSSHSITTGSKTFTVQSGLSYTATQDVTIVYDSNPTGQHMHGVVTSYSGTTLVVNVESIQGSGGPFTAWTINVGGLLTAQGALLEANNLSDVANPATALTNIGGVPTSRTISSGTGLTGGGDLTANRTLAVSYGTTAGTAAEGNDARLSDARTPTSHASSHGSAGSDPVTLDASQIGSGTFNNARINFAAPSAIGSTTPNTVAATDLSASNKLSLPSAAAASPTAGDLYRNANTIRYRDGTNTERLLLNATDNLANLASAATSRTNLGVGSSDAVTFGSIQNTPIGSTTAAAITGTTGTFSTLSANNGTLTASAPVLDLSQTWNNAAVTFTGLRFNATNTNSAADSRLAEFQVNGTPVTSIRRDGALRLHGTGNVTAIVGNSATLATAGNGSIWYTPQSIWTESAYAIIAPSGTPAIYLSRDADSVLALRNGAKAHELRIYGTHTSDTNYQRMTVKSARQTLSALSGASATTTGTFIPDGAVVVGVTTRVATALTGATGYTIGNGTDADRWGDITGTAIGTTSDNRDWTAATIECFTAGGNITLTAKTSNFTAGAIEVCVFYLAGEAD